LNFLIERIHVCVTLAELDLLEWEVKESNDNKIIETFNKKKDDLTIR
jgi:hypothetical protein